MLFWIAAALLTLGSSLVVLLPLARRSRGYASAREHEIEVYRDQLSELDRDAARGLIQPAEVAEARAEIGRRILRAAGTGADEKAQPRFGTLARAVSAAAVLAVPLVSWGMYAGLGSPDQPGQPLSARLAADPATESIDVLLARAESHLAANPADARGWAVIAPVYMRLGRFDDAVAAYRRIIEIDGSSAERQANLGEALFNAAGGLVTEAAKTAFDTAVAADPKDIRARFYLATSMAQQGDMQAASAAWQAMLTDLPAETPWRGAVQGALDEVARRTAAAAPGSGAAPAPGPAQADVDAAAEMSPEDRTAMIQSMVTRLDERLRDNPKDTDGWKRLVRSYMVLGDAAKARDALDRGLKALDGTSEDGKALAAFAATVGVSATQ